MLRILLVEDNEGDVDLTREAIKASRSLIYLQVVSDGVAAMEFLQDLAHRSPKLLPDLILLDLNLPKKDGRQVLAEIKTDRMLRSVPVIVLTSSEAEPDVFKSYQLGANCYIVKPVGFKAYREIVQTIDEFWMNTVRLPPKEPLAAQRRAFHHWPADELKRGEIRLLLIEDNEADADLVRNYLENRAGFHFDIHSVSRLQDGLNYLMESNVDVILSDLGLPDSSGLQTLDRLRGAAPEIPIVVLTGEEDPALALKAIQGKAQEFLVKNQIASGFLPRVIHYALKRKESELALAQLVARERAARADAENAIQLRDEFLSIASHELKTPVTSLRLQIQLLAKMLEGGAPEKIPKEKVADLLGRANSQLSRFTNLIYMLLDVSRLQAGRLGLEKREVNLKSLIQDMSAHLSDEARRTNCQLIIEVQDVVGFWDANRLEQVIVNLMTNAMKYAPGHPIEVRGYRRGKVAFIEVQDHGVGIRKEDQAKVFERFERADRGSNVSGFGLGLYIVRQIVDAHGGSIRVESEYGQGATFVIQLPIQAENEPLAASA